MSFLVHIADRVLNRPLLITRDKAQVIMSVLAGRIGISGIGEPEASRFEGTDIVENEDGKKFRVPYRVSNGVAIVTVTGSLVNRGAWVGANSGLTSYEGIQHQLKSAVNDSKVHSILLDLHTPGGEAVGAFETSDAVREAARKKRTVAVINGIAASAGYALASGATEIVTTETGVSGSIGVVLLHADYSRALANEGINPTLIFAGAHKVDGNPFEALSQDVRSDLQEEVNSFYNMFTKTVGKGRGSRLTAASARKTEARTFIGQAAVDAGLADRVGTFETVLSDLSKAVGRKSTVQNKGASSMDNNDTTFISRADHEREVAASRVAGVAEGRAAGVTEGTTVGATNERQRISSIISTEGIRGNAARLSAALELAVESPDLSAERVAAFTIKNVAEEAPSASLQSRANLPDSLAAISAGDQPVKKSGTDTWADFRKKRA